MQAVSANDLAELLTKIADAGRVLVTLPGPPDPLAEQRRRILCLRSLFDLSRAESRVLVRLMQDEAVTKEELRVTVTDGDPTTDRHVIVVICNLRKRLKPHGISISTLWGSGYNLPADSRAKIEQLLDGQKP